MRKGVLLIAVVAVVGAAPAQAVAPVRPRVSLAVGDRTGFDYRWEYDVGVRVSARATGRPLKQVHVDAVGVMNVPGHNMQTVPARFASNGDGTYGGKLAFYMPGKWTIRVTVSGKGVVRTTASFRIFLDPATPAP